MQIIFGVTSGDSSGIGPEILLKAWSMGAIRHPIVAFGDLEVLSFYNDRFGYGVTLSKINSPRGTP